MTLVKLFKAQLLLYFGCSIEKCQRLVAVLLGDPLSQQHSPQFNRKRRVLSNPTSKQWVRILSILSDVDAVFVSPCGADSVFVQFPSPVRLLQCHPCLRLEGCLVWTQSSVRGSAFSHTLGPIVGFSWQQISTLNWSSCRLLSRQRDCLGRRLLGSTGTRAAKRPGVLVDRSLFGFRSLYLADGPPSETFQPNNLPWTNVTNSEDNVTYYLTVYGILAVANTLFTLARAFLFAYGGICAATTIHKYLLSSILKVKVVPLLFAFDGN